MALKATIFKAELQVSDMDRHYYASHSLTLARHPSETDERMMVRLLAFALYADERLEFGRGLSAEDEPALWNRDLTGEIKLWIDVGLPDEKDLRRACGKARQVVVLSYGGAGADIWWGKQQAGLSRLQNLAVWKLPLDATKALAALADRSMNLQCNIQDGQAWFMSDTESVQISPIRLQEAAG